MSKSKKAKQDTTPYKNYLKYLNGVDTSNVDTTLNNFTDFANQASQNLNSMGDYSFSVDGSDDARQRAEQATYQSYIDYLNPQFERQTADYSTMLQNKGLPVGSEAYERAMSDLQDRQNAAINQAAYQSVLNGQNAFSQSLGDEVTAGQYGNAAQQAYINQIISLLQGSPSAYENQQNIYAAGTSKSAADYQNAKAKAKGGIGGAITGALTGGISGLVSSGGNPFAGLAGAGLGAYSGYNSNPYAN